MFDYAKLKGRIVEIFGTQESFADAMGVSVTAINQRLNGSVEWKTPQIVKACELLHIPLEDAHLYFFVEKILIS